MASFSTIYDVGVRYRVDDQAARGILGIGTAADRASRSTTTLGQSVRNMALLVGGGFVLGKAKNALIDFNAGIERAQIGLAGIIKLNLGGTFDEARQKGHALFRQFQEDAKRSLGTTKDFLEFGTNIAAPLFTAGGNLGDLREITRGAIVASQALGIQSDVAALDIQQFLQGALTLRERFARMLFEPMGLTGEQINKMTASQRVTLLKDLLSQPAVGEMAKGFETSFSGALSTLQDNIEILLGKVGLPLFQAITDQIRQWNTWIEQHPEQMKRFAQEFGQLLRDGFEMFRDVVKFFVENRETLLALAKAFLVFKGMQALGGTASNFAGLIQNLGKFDKSITGAASAVGLLSAAAIGFHQLMEGAIQQLGRQIDRNAEIASIVDAQRRLDLGGQFGAEKTLFAQKARELGLVDEQGRFLRDKAFQELRERGQIIWENLIPEDIREGRHQPIYHEARKRYEEARQKALFALVESLEAAVLQFDDVALNRMVGGLGGPSLQSAALDAAKSFAEQQAKLKETEKKANVNIRNVIEVKSNDPDRFAFQFMELMEEQARAPTHAKRALRRL